ncbi:GerAB/ArcD/ProY family transporter [Paenibacillus silvae]|uniref:GerAB/ArcD/ProY family transporter n=1 Tax=Paenibacillus silvae TaxID=1325358 RepID=UPI00119CE8AA|nr:MULTISPECIES: endospore germination permease [Paenibacillus]MCK6077920.1 endospore germination permease [Paenibacillus silvae]MCK6152119.1 endospore germination permease [Paenibacillus silvae]MCK6270804.1 endospore germination permease [Paenibacillus silvae]
MGQDKGQITIWLSISIILLSAGLVCHVLSIPAILDAAGRDGWLSVLAAAPLFMLFLAMMYIIMRRIHGQRLPDWIAREFGHVTAWIFRITAALLLFSLGTHTLYETTNWTVSTYLPFTPTYVLAGAGALVAAWSAAKGIRSIAMTSSILLPLVIVLGYFVMSANMKYKDYSQLFPILENGWAPVMRGVIYSLAGLMEIWILMLFQHEIKSKFRWWHILLLGIFMISMAVGPTMGAIVEFGPEEAAKQRNSPFEQWKLVNIGKLFQHVDFLSIYQWLSGAFARVAISMYLITDLLNFRRPRKRYIAILCITLLMCALAIQWWRIDYVDYYVDHIQFPVMLSYVSIVTILLTLAALLHKKDKEEPAHGPSTANDTNPSRG